MKVAFYRGATRRASRAPTAADVQTRAEAALVEELYDEYGAALYSYALGFLGDPGRAGDLVQEVMLRAWRHADSVPPRTGTPRAWLFAVARNLLTDWHRAAQRRPENLTGPDEFPDLAVLDEEMDRVLQASQMTEALGRLSPEHRAVLQEVYYRGRTTLEAARALDIPVGTVKSRTYHALNRLRLVLLEMGVQP